MTQKTVRPLPLPPTPNSGFAAVTELEDEVGVALES